MQFFGRFRQFALVALFALYSVQSLGAPIPGTRGLENTGIDQFVETLQKGDVAGVANWLKTAADSVPANADTTSFPMVFATALRTLAIEAQKLSAGDSRAAASALSQKIFEQQMRLRSSIKLGGSLEFERRAFILLQTALEETVLYANSGAPVVFVNKKLTPAELAGAGQIRGIDVVAGDHIVQIGATWMSSHFIAHSQSLPGLASHGLVVSKAGTKPEIIEALIEDGVNRRDPTTSALARMWVLSAKKVEERARVGQSVQDFISKEKIDYIANGAHSTNSPLLYDSTMNPDRIKDGYYFCTALVQEIYRRAGVNTNPYLENTLNWNILTGTEKGLYEQLDIKASKVPAPGDSLFNPDMVVRSLVLDAPALRDSRRLRATVDAMFDIINADAQTRGELLAAFQKIPTQEIRKREILAAVDGFIRDPQVQKLLGVGDATALEKARLKIQDSLPQTANLRQIAFFMILNEVIQNKALEALRAFEDLELKRHATPGELRARATQFLGQALANRDGHLKDLSKYLEAMAKAAAAAGARP